MSATKNGHPDLEELVFDSVFEKDNELALLDIVPVRIKLTRMLQLKKQLIHPHHLPLKYISEIYPDIGKARRN